jgi:hypothetical protein
MAPSAGSWESPCAGGPPWKHRSPRTWTRCGPSGPSCASRWWRSRTRWLAADLREHVELTESAEGLYAGLRQTAPRLGTRVDAQLAEHAELLARVDRLLGERDGGLESDDALAQTRAGAADLLELVGRHRRRGNDLFHEAWDVDLGGSG